MKPCALLVATLVGTLSGCGPQECHSTLLEVQHTAAGVPSPAIAPGATTELHLQGLRRLGCDGSLSSSAYDPLRVGDGRAIAGIGEAPRSATPGVCTLAPAEERERAREVLEFHLPHARDYQRSAWELRAVARGTCRVEARVGEVVAQTLVEVD